MSTRGISVDRRRTTGVLSGAQSRRRRGGARALTRDTGVIAEHFRRGRGIIGALGTRLHAIGTLDEEDVQ